MDQPVNMNLSLKLSGRDMYGNASELPTFDSSPTWTLVSGESLGSLNAAGNEATFYPNGQLGGARVHASATKDGNPMSADFDFNLVAGPGNSFTIEVA